MKIIEQKTTKEALKERLDSIATKAGIEWHAQKAHRIAVASFFLDALGIINQKERDEMLTLFLKTPSSFGCNASSLGQSLGRPKAADIIASTFAGF